MANIFLYSFGKEGQEKDDFFYPRDLTFDPCGNILVCDSENNRIKVLNKDCDFLFSFEADFVPDAITYDHKENILVCDTLNECVQIYNKEFKLIKTLYNEQFFFPEGITCDHEGNIIFCVSDKHKIKVYSKDYNFIFSFGEEGQKEGQFNYPTGLVCDHSGNIIVSDSENHRIQVFKFEPKAQKLEAKFLFSFGKYGEKEGEFIRPSGVTCDHEGNILICDSGNFRIQVYSKDYKFLYSFGKFGEKDGEFVFPRRIKCDQNGDIFVCDTRNHRIQVFKGPSEVPSLLSMCWKNIHKYRL
jgi:tripartite motif-containing protein 71